MFVKTDAALWKDAADAGWPNTAGVQVKIEPHVRAGNTRKLLSR